MSPDRSAHGRRTTPLAVDLDGTLLRTDLLAESLLLLLKKNPFYALLVPFWCAGGLAVLKRRIAERVRVDPALLPYNEEFVSFLREERRSGRVLLLATASDILLARPVAERLGLFSAVIGSDGEKNLVGAAKREAIEKHLGGESFDYAGDSPRDLPIWRAAENAVLVGPSSKLLQSVSRATTVHRVFENGAGSLAEAARAMRPHQWVKNLLLFVPFATAHKLGDAALLPGALGAFVAFSLTASGIYIVNDLLDLNADRAHPDKRGRPFASGALPIAFGPPLALALLAFGAGLALFLPREFLPVLGLYAATTTLYSLYLKELVLVDVFCLAGLYTLRIFAGHAVSGIAHSQWLFTFSMFLFLSLALLKRYTELRALGEDKQGGPPGRGYVAGDLNFVRGFGTASGYLSVLVFALYINSPQMSVLYARPALLWLICPLLLYWISRIWLLAGRGKVDADPVVFALKDGASYLCAATVAALMALAAR